jgi:hypothetical protein
MRRCDWPILDRILKENYFELNLNQIASDTLYPFILSPAKQKTEGWM